MCGGRRVICRSSFMPTRLARRVGVSIGLDLLEITFQPLSNWLEHDRPASLCHVSHHKQARKCPVHKKQKIHKPGQGFEPERTMPSWMPCLALSCRSLSYPVFTLPCIAVPCRALPCLVLPCPAMSYLVMLSFALSILA